MEFVKPRVAGLAQVVWGPDTVTLVTSAGQKLSPMIRAAPTRPRLWGSITDTVPELSDCTLKVACCSGSGGVPTKAPLVSVALVPSGLVTVTLWAPAVAAGVTVRLAISCVEEANLQEFTMMPAPKSHCAPALKLVPRRFTSGALPGYRVVGTTCVTVGC